MSWDALDERSWPGVSEMEPADIARVLAMYAQRVITPRGSTAVSGLELMTADPILRAYAVRLIEAGS